MNAKIVKSLKWEGLYCDSWYVWWFSVWCKEKSLKVCLGPWHFRLYYFHAFSKSVTLHIYFWRNKNNMWALALWAERIKFWKWQQPTPEDLLISADKSAQTLQMIQQKRQCWWSHILDNGEENLYKHILWSYKVIWEWKDF